jgi:Prephenate dehydratase
MYYLLIAIFLIIHTSLASPPFILPQDATVTSPLRLYKSQESTKSSSTTTRTTNSSENSQDGDNIESSIQQPPSQQQQHQASPTSMKPNLITSQNPGTPPSLVSTPIRVCYQGEPGAYSEKSLRELLGPNVIAVPRPDFESCYRAVASRECDYACLPVENSLGGSIHDNYDLQLKYDLTIVAEHECRVRHCLHAIHGVKKGDIKYCMSHPQALAQCDNYLRGLRIKPIPVYDTAGAVKLLKDSAKAKKDPNYKPDRALPEMCSVENTAAIASDLAGVTYNLNCLDRGIEDDDTNFTRFLLLGRASVSQYLNKNVPAKTSIVFTLPNTPGALYKALACFSLREIDFSKIESRPTSASLLNYLKFKNRQRGDGVSQADLPRFRYCFYLDFLASELDENAQNALHHLKEQAEFCRILGSYPQKSRLVGPVYDAVQYAKHWNIENGSQLTQMKLPSDEGVMKINIGIMGYGAYGKFLGRKFAEKHSVRCIDVLDKVSGCSRDRE